MSKRDGRPLVFIDVAMPRDVDPAVSEISGVRLFNIDDLQTDAGEREERRRANIPKAEKIIEEEIGKWDTRQAGMNLAPVISSLCKLFENARQEELEKIANTLEAVSPDQREVIEQMTRAIVGRVLHSPIVRMKEMAAMGEDPSSVLCDLFSLSVVSSNKGNG
jgi:glutamyl-tRNA reductase